MNHNFNWVLKLEIFSLLSCLKLESTDAIDAIDVLNIFLKMCIFSVLNVLGQIFRNLESEAKSECAILFSSSKSTKIDLSHF
jgi:hypothetical protein